MAPEPLIVLNPTVDTNREKIQSAHRPDALHGRVICLLANRKRNADRLLEEIGEILVRDYGVRSTISVAKNSSSRLAQPDLFENLVNGCDAVITGIGDCGSSSSFSVCDAIELEKKGTPAAVLVTEALRSNAATTAEKLGAADYSFATIPHPIASLVWEEIRDIAENVTPCVARILLGNRIA